MPFSEFQNGNAGLALPSFQLQSQDAFASLMERAQRVKIGQEDFKLKQEAHAANLMTSALQQDQARANITMMGIQNTEAETKARDLASVRERYVEAAPKIEENLQAILAEQSPVKQRRMLYMLQSQSSQFYRDPALKAVIEAQVSPVLESIAANEASGLAQAGNEGRLFPNREAALLQAPGQGLNFQVHPSTGVGVWVTTGKPDPQKEASALSEMALARDEKELNDAVQKPEVAMMFGVPGSGVREGFKNRRDLFAKEAQQNEKNAIDRAQAQAAGAPKQIPVSLLESTEKMKRAYNDLQGIKDTFDTDPNIKGPFVGFVREFNPYDLTAQELRAKITAAVPNLARGVFGEVGVLTDADIANYKRLLPTTRNTEEAAGILFQFLSKKLETVYDDRLAVLEKQGYNTAGFTKNKKPRTPVNGSAAQRIINGGTVSPPTK